MKLGRRVLLGWFAGLGVLCALFAYAWLRNPVVEGASAGQDPARNGLVSLALMLPVLLTSWRLGRFNQGNVVGAWVLPVLLATGLGILAGAVAVVPENAGYCNLLIDEGRPVPGACATPPSVRLAIFAEAAGLWALFGVLCAAARRWVTPEPVRP